MRGYRSNCNKAEEELIHSIRKYVRFSTYRRIIATYKDKKKIEGSICIPYRVKKREEKNKRFLRLIAKVNRVLYGGSGKDTQTLINIMDLAFMKKDYMLIGPLAELLEPEEDDVEAIRLKNRLLYSRSNLTEFNVPDKKKKQDERGE